MAVLSSSLFSQMQYEKKKMLLNFCISKLTFSLNEWYVVKCNQTLQEWSLKKFRLVQTWSWFSMCREGPSWPWSYGCWITYEISAYHHWCCKFKSWSGRGVQHYVCQWLATGQWFSPGPLVSSTNKTDCHDITEILLKVALNTIKPNPANHVNILKVLLKNHL